MATFLSKWDRIKKYAHQIKFKSKLNKEKRKLESITPCPYYKDRIVRTNCWSCQDFVRTGRGYVTCCHARARKKDFDI